MKSRIATSLALGGVLLTGVAAAAVNTQALFNTKGAADNSTLVSLISPTSSASPVAVIDPVTGAVTYVYETSYQQVGTSDGAKKTSTGGTSGTATDPTPAVDPTTPAPDPTTAAPDPKPTVEPTTDPFPVVSDDGEDSEDGEDGEGDD